MTDRVFIACHQCGEEVAGESVEAGEKVPPWLEIRWHEKVIVRIRRAHLRQPRRRADG